MSYDLINRCLTVRMIKYSVNPNGDNRIVRTSIGAMTRPLIRSERLSRYIHRPMNRSKAIRCAHTVAVPAGVLSSGWPATRAGRRRAG